MTSGLSLLASADTSQVQTVMIGIILLSLAPFLLTVATSFAKIVIVTSIVRQAIGLPQVPPTSVVTGMALILTLYVSAPVALKIYSDYESESNRIATESGVETAEQRSASQAAASNRNEFSDAKLWWKVARPHLRDHLESNSTPRNRNLFEGLFRSRAGSDLPKLVDQLSFSNDSNGPNAPAQTRPIDQAAATSPHAPSSQATAGSDIQFFWLVPAFMLTELTEALIIGFLIFVPFLVIDLVVSNILLAVGMQMVTPNVISLPIKLLLFVLMDGWTLIYRGLVESYPISSGGGL
jgi:type III secretion protein R